MEAARTGSDDCSHRLRAQLTPLLPGSGSHVVATSPETHSTWRNRSFESCLFELRFRAPRMQRATVCENLHARPPRLIAILDYEHKKRRWSQLQDSVASAPADFPGTSAPCSAYPRQLPPAA